ncbi:MAG: hypothetical protein NUV82_01190 [Candidatus Komeilibacteria bacterium]|nr:hypothetical protein [Candidatus Komeilibacteria bacterium]
MHFSAKLKQFRNTVISIAFIVTILVLVISLLLPQRYSSEAKVLIVQRQTASLDAYLATKSAEKVGQMLTEVVYSSSFFDKVWNSGYNIGTDWGENERERRDLWRQRMALSMVPQTSLLKVTAYHTDKPTAERITQAVVYVLTQQGEEYYGATENLQIKLVDRPINSRFPVKPNIIVNTVLGLIVGVMIGMLYVYFKPWVRRSENQ